MNGILEEHLKLKNLSTCDAWTLLKLPESFEYNYAANTYIIALHEISALRAQLAEAKRIIEPFSDAGKFLFDKPASHRIAYINSNGTASDIGCVSSLFEADKWMEVNSHIS